MKHTALAVVLSIASATAMNAKLVTKPVAYEHAGTKLEGYLAYDDAKVSADKPAPGVLVVHEWWGLNDYTKSRTRQLAEMGYVAFALDMYGAGISTEEPSKAMELSSPFYGKPLMPQRAQAGLDQLLATGLVDPSRVAAIGFCFGGSTVQTLAYSGAPLKGIVSFHGGLVPITAVPGAAEATKAKFLILHGGADPFTKPEDMLSFQQALEKAGVDYQFIIYGGALHAFTNPDATRISKEKNLQGIGYNEAAAKRSWKQMQIFFKEIFGTKSKDPAN